MTRQLKVVNLSNHDGEDFVVSGPHVGSIMLDSAGEASKLVMPAESADVQLYAGETGLRIKAVDTKPPEPFRDAYGRQLSPEMELFLGNGSRSAALVKLDYLTTLIRGRGTRLGTEVSLAEKLDKILDQLLRMA